jgi:phosphoribosylanthranilate isomerase
MPNETARVKICGIRNLEDALTAAEAGANLIGLVFVPGRPRRLEIDAAREITAGIKNIGAGAPRAVGLFAGQPLDEVNRTIQECGLDLAQLCGLEPLDYCGNIRADVIKVVHVAGDIDINPEITRAARGDASAQQGLRELEGLVGSYTRRGHIVTLDRLVDGIPGGTGQSFNWDVAAHLSRGGHSFILAGGLTPDTVAQAITDVQPWGVDVSSGVETGGVKDPEKIRAFVRNAKGAMRKAGHNKG